MAANEAVQDGYGGISRISRACGLSRGTIPKGMRELEEDPVAAGRIRRPGGFISSNWRGEPLRDYETIVRLIAGTTTAKGLAVSCRLDRRKYPPGAK